MTQTALIVVDTLNRYDHETENARGVRPQSLPHIVDLRDQAQRRDDVLLVYVNDNRDAEPEALVEHALSGGHPELVEPIAPTDPVPFLPKGRHSIFYQTPLDHLLRVENVERLVLTGQVTEQCILYSALDAYLRGYQLAVPPTP